MINNKSFYILVLSFLLLFSCEPVDLTSLENKLNSIAIKQGEALDKLAVVEENQNEIKKEMTELKKIQSSNTKTKDNKKQQPPKADPNKVYDIAIGNSVVLGKEDASVTIIEWTDFQ